MAMRIYQINFADIANQISARLDPKYRHFWDIEKGFLFEGLPCTKLGNLISEIRISKLKKGELEETKGLMSIPNQVGRSARIQNIEDVEELDSDKNPLHNSDIIISKLGLPKGLIFYNDKKYENLIGSSEFIPYKIENLDWNAKFLTYLLLLPNVLVKLAQLESGKTPSHKRVNPFDLLNVKVPLIATNKQNEAIEKIEHIEREIEHLQAQIGEPTEPINRVFAREFNFNIEKFEELKQQKIFPVKFQDFSDNQDLRFSAKFHRPAAMFVESELRNITNKSIKDFISEDIVLGSSVSPSDYDDTGDFYYIAMSSIKNWSFDKDISRLVSDDFSEKNSAKHVSESDIIVARSGEGTIGKVALIEGDVKGIFADFTMRIRLKNYNTKFAYYYFRTEYFQYLIEVHKKGLGNNTNIFPNQIKHFPMPDISPEKQTEILDEINEEFSKQDLIKREIENKRKEIDHIIKQVLE